MRRKPPKTPPEAGTKVEVELVPGDVVEGKFRFTIDLGEGIMAQINGSFTLVVNPAAQQSNPLTLTPNNVALNAEQEGVNEPGQLVTTVKGGVPPYSYTNVTGVPSGMELNNSLNADGTENIVLTGTPNVGDAAQSPYTIGFTVTDSAGTSVSTNVKTAVATAAAATVPTPAPTPTPLVKK